MTSGVRAKHVPLRRCAVCRAQAPQAELLRLVKGEAGFRLDLKRRLGGRGTWICSECAASSNEKRLRHAFRGSAQQVRELLDAALAHVPPTAAGAAGIPPRRLE